jgi:hypothetical protein
MSASDSVVSNESTQNAEEIKDSARYAGAPGEYICTRDRVRMQKTL